MTTTKRQKPLTLLVILALLFISPSLVAWVLFTQQDHLTFKQTHQGKLIDPPLSIDQLTLVTSHHLPAQTQLLGKWTLLYLARHCDDPTCEQALNSLKQLPVVLRRDAERLQLSLATTTTPSHSDNATYPVFISQEDYSKLHELGSFFIIDPHGNIILAYPSVAPKAAYKDLKRLLKYSRIG